MFSGKNVILAVPHKLRYMLLIAAWSGIILSSCRTPSAITRKPEVRDTATGKSFYSACSDKLGVRLNGTEDCELIREVCAWLGTPYKYAGEDRSGTDCSGLTFAIYKKVYNISLYRSSGDQIRNTSPVSKKDLRCGDLVFFKISDDKISHVGLYIADNKFIHASTKRGVVINDLNEDYYLKHYFSSGRVRGLADIR